MKWLIVYHLASGMLAYDYVDPATCIEDALRDGGLIEIEDGETLPFTRASCKGPQGFGPPANSGYGIDAPIYPQVGKQ